MTPIYEQGSGNGIGHNLQSFLDRFNLICSDHVTNKRAKAFAFIFYDFTNHAVKRVLRNQGVFTKLDRLSGKELSVFYLHTGSERAVETFNRQFLCALGVNDQATPPCVVFFRLDNEQIEDVEIVQLESADLIHGFSELYGVLASYIKRQPTSEGESTALKWIKVSGKFIGIETFKLLLKRGLDFIL